MNIGEKNERNTFLTCPPLSPGIFICMNRILANHQTIFPRRQYQSNDSFPIIIKIKYVVNFVQGGHEGWEGFQPISQPKFYWIPFLARQNWWCKFQSQSGGLTWTRDMWWFFWTKSAWSVFKIIRTVIILNIVIVHSLHCILLSTS